MIICIVVNIFQKTLLQSKINFDILFELIKKIKINYLSFHSFKTCILAFKGQYNYFFSLLNKNTYKDFNLKSISFS